MAAASSTTAKKGFDHDSNLNERVGAMEIDIQHLNKDVQTLGAQITRMEQAVYDKIDSIAAAHSANLKAMYEKMDSISNHHQQAIASIAQRNQITFPLIFGVVSIFLTAIGMVAAGGWIIHNTTLQPVVLVTNQNQESIREFKDIPEQVAVLEATLPLQREMLELRIKHLTQNFEAQLQLEAVQSNRFTSAEGAALLEKVKNLEDRYERVDQAP